MEATINATLVEFRTERVWHPHSDPVLTSAFSPDGSLIATGSYDKTACVIDAATGKVVYSVTHSSSIWGVAWHQDGKRLMASCFDGTVIEVSQSDGKWTHRTIYQHAGHPYGCAVSRSGLVAISCEAKCVELLDSKSNYSVKQKIDGLVQHVLNVAFSSTDSLLAIGCTDGTHYIYAFDRSTNTYERIVQQKKHSMQVRSLCFSPSDSHLAIGGDDKLVTVWEVPSSPDASTWPKLPSATLKGHRATVNAILFSGDGSHVITASYDETIRIWRVKGGRHVSALVPKDRVCSACFHAPTGRLLAGMFDGFTQTWRCAAYVEADPSSYADARTRLQNAEAEITLSELKLDDSTSKDTTQAS